MKIRPGTESDLPRALELIVELAVFEKEPDAVVTTVESMCRDGFGDNPIFGFFVAEREEQQADTQLRGQTASDEHPIVGISLYYWRYSTWKGKRLYLEDLIVTENARGFGYGKALFEHTVRFAFEQNCRGMMWQVLDWNQPAIDFYKAYRADLDGEWINCSFSEEQLRDFYEKNEPIQG